MKRWRALLFLLGATVLIYVVRRAGISILAAHAAQAGWWLVPIVLLYFPVYTLNALAWRLIMPASHAPSFARILAITISGFAINYITPVVNLGGEPYKIAMVARQLGRPGAVASVLVFTMLHALSHLLIWQTGILLALLVLRPGAVAAAALLAVAALLTGLIALLLRHQRRGVLQDLHAFALRLPLVRRLARRLSDRQEAMAEVDRQIGAFYQQQPRRFALALSVEYAARAVAACEYWLIFSALGMPLGYTHAFIVAAFSSLILNLFFFMPFEMGSREGGLYAVLSSMTANGALGVFAGLVTRLREILWIGVGLLLLAVTPRPAE